MEAPDRLDFTAIGPAVNVASRIEGLCRPRGCPVLVPGDVATRCGTQLAPLGDYSLRGSTRPVTLFTLSELAPPGTKGLMREPLIAGFPDNITDSLSIHMHQEPQKLGKERLAVRFRFGTRRRMSWLQGASLYDKMDSDAANYALSSIDCGPVWFFVWRGKRRLYLSHYRLSLSGNMANRSSDRSRPRTQSVRSGLNGLNRWRQASYSSITAIWLRQTLGLKVTAALLEVKYTAARINGEIDDLNDLKGSIEEKDEHRTKLIDLGTLFMAVGSGAVGPGLDLKSGTSQAGNIVSVASGSIAAGLSIAAGQIKENASGSLKTVIPSMLSQILGRSPQPNDRYPNAVWKFLTTEDRPSGLE